MKRIGMSKIKFYEPFLWVYFIWYYLPIVRVFLKSNTYNLIFFSIMVGGCALCFLQMLSNARKLRIEYTPLVPVLLYFCVFIVMSILEIGSAGRHIRVSFSFWGTLFVFYLSGYFPDMRKRLAKLMFFLFFITAITSVVGVLVNPNAARLLAFSGNNLEEDILIRLMNIGGLAFFQGLVIFVPILMSFYFGNKYRALCVLLIIVVFLGVLGASFSICLIMFFIAVLLSQIANGSFSKNSLLTVLLVVGVLMIPWEDFLYFLAEHINNERFELRLLSLANSLESGLAEGNLESRLDLYLASMDTFLRNPLGVGPEYTFINYQKGIGYHSQVLDDLARYGIFAIAFYIAFFVGYNRLLRKQWAKINMEQVAWPVTLIYFLFLVLNPGFTSEHESVLLLFLIPAVPEIMQKV